MPKHARILTAKLIFCFALPLLVLLLPTEQMPIEGLTLIQHRLLGIFLLAALLWILEPVPVFATSVLIIALELIMLSDKGLQFFRITKPEQSLGELIPYSDILNTFSSPIIILFMGGFTLAIAASKYDLDKNLARSAATFGAQPKFIMLGLMLITAVFSMFMSNTATTVMMLALVNILAQKEQVDQGVNFVYSSRGKYGRNRYPHWLTSKCNCPPIPNRRTQYHFFSWMMIGLPLVIVQLIAAWFLLQKLFPSQVNFLILELDGQAQRSWQAIVVYITFFSTVLLDDHPSSRYEYVRLLWFLWWYLH